MEIMKKLLLGLLPIVISSYGFASTDQTDSSAKQEKKSTEENKPELDISGSAAVHTAFTFPKNRYYSKEAEKADKDTKDARVVGGEANIDFTAKGTLNNGLKYGATISVDAMKGDTGVDKMYLSFERDNLGTLQIGNVKGVEAVNVYSGQQLLGGTCGVDGTVPHDIDWAAGVISPLYLIGYTSKATKIAYYSPRIYGLQFGVSYTPDTKHEGHKDKNRKSGNAKSNDAGIYRRTHLPKGYIESPSGKNSLAFGLNHQHSFENGFGTQFGAVYLFENTKKVGIYDKDDNLEKKFALRKARGYHLTGTVSYKNFAIGVGYLNNGKSRLPKDDYNAFLNEEESCANGVAQYHPNYGKYEGGFLATKNSNSGSAWNVGAQYKWNDWTFAAVFHRTQRKVDKGQKTKGNMITFTADYKVCDGLLVFFEFDNIKTKSCNTACEMYNKMFRQDKVNKDGKNEPKNYDTKGNAIKKQTCQLFAIGAKVSF